ncbi:enoyl-CoA hydratase/isomerase family protein [uncultured Dysosmobacter sp.]|uniref:enoyl-CoA hydratase/isomerase family protein n=1 Tax=uncultured Dysosmobacter sp. TaxID=2591384 RepID=UPI0026394C6C|nr:enoyl-CoA hydratase/isomerase family protein [uncultured Dysosmobacter sp.]
MEFTQIIYQKEQFVSTIILNRPEKLNALTDVMLREVREALRDSDADDNIRVIILKGAGRAFSAGFDLSPEVSTYSTAQEWRGHITNGNETFRTIWEIEKPVIAMVQGYCLGGAFDFTMSCDIVISSDKGVFGEPENLFGGVPMYLLLPYITNMRVVRRILLTGENFSAQQALDWNLISYVVQHDRLEEETLKLAKRIAALPFGTPQLNKRTLNRIYDNMGAKEAIMTSGDAAIWALSRAKEPELSEFFEKVNTIGTKAALKWRNDKFEQL